MHKRSVCWNITPRCNSSCKFCYRNIEKKENNLHQNMQIIKILSELGIDKVTFSGGESLLYPELTELLKASHELNITSSVITNGKVLNEEKIKQLEKYVDYIIFSIDALDDKINQEIGRGENQGSNVLQLMKYISSSGMNMQLKLNTVVHKKNMEQIECIAEAIKDIPIVRWKLFKFCGLRGSSIVNFDEYSISNEEYDNIVDSINANCRIEKINEKNIEDNYLLVDAEGNFFITKNSQDKIICNYKDVDIEKIKELLWN